MQTDSKEITHLIVGYSLIAIGILVMLMSCWQVYRIITKQSEPIRFFSFPGIKIDLSQMAPKVDTSSLDALKQQLNLGGSGVRPAVETPYQTEILPAEVLNGPANLGVSMLFMGFVLNFGARIADIGTKLVRPINYQIKS